MRRLLPLLLGLVAHAVFAGEPLARDDDRLNGSSDTWFAKLGVRFQTRKLF